MNKIELSEKELLEAIERSGYLLESQTVKHLVSKGYFVESNVSILDPHTNKSREIDLVAEFYEYDEKVARCKVAAKTHFIFEIKNNLYPIVLLTQMEYSPNNPIWEGLREITTIPQGLEYDSYSGYYEKLLEEKDSMFTQYCSFQNKKGNNQELMAIHPDNLHSGFSKILQYCDESVERWDRDKNSETYYDEYFRHFLYVPILLVRDGLYELDINKNNLTNLKKVDISRLVFNYHRNSVPMISIIYVMTQNGLDSFLQKFRGIEKEITNKMLQITGHNKL